MSIFLEQLSWLEGDDLNYNNGGYGSGLDEHKDDRGDLDGVVWILSPAQVIKEANSSSYRSIVPWKNTGYLQVNEMGAQLHN